MDTLSIDSGYTLTVISDDQVALAGSIPTGRAASPYFIISLIVVMAVVAAVFATVYFYKLNEYRKILAGLQSQTDTEIQNTGISITKIKEKITGIQNELAEKEISEFLNE